MSEAARKLESSTHPHRSSVLPYSPAQLIRKLVERFPERWAGSDDERHAQEYLAELFQSHADSVELKPFRFSTNLYGVIALHFGIALIGSVVAFWSPIAAAVIQGSVGVLYLLDSARWCYVLRRFVPHCASQNLVAIQSAKGRLRKRVVVVGHVDAARAGICFRLPGAKIASPKTPVWITELLKPMRLAVVGMFVLAGTHLLGHFVPHSWSFPIAFYCFTGLTITLFVLNAEAAVAPIVPGANDNLSGSVAVLYMARVFQHEKPDDVELVYVITGCEEAGTGGAYQLARQLSGEWDPELTSILVLDGLGAGQLSLFVEGEIVPVRSDRQMIRVADKVARRLLGQPLPRYRLPAGATDQVGFAASGFRGIALGCIDPQVGQPANYHSLDDTPENIEEQTLNDSLRFATEFTRQWAQARIEGRHAIPYNEFLPSSTEC